mmetsp:Transcript_26826/g.43606  ORF Transcript_26826/g.43606 Transcript_26826/m.43606 type:complete len:102 (+) Transcript_26826:1556-1861(+)
MAFYRLSVVLVTGKDSDPRRYYLLFVTLWMELNHWYFLSPSKGIVSKKYQIWVDGILEMLMSGGNEAGVYGYTALDMLMLAVGCLLYMDDIHMDRYILVDE